jgi:serine/threonine protein kinase
MALKELRMDLALSPESSYAFRMFDTERNVLRQISALGHHHLLKAITTFERGETRYLLFPWADGGDLREFWMQGDVIRPPTEGLILEALGQLLGLADAILWLHHLKLSHGDVKPENILRFEDGTVVGNLRLGDMGLAKQHALETQLRRHGTTTVFTTPRYQPPEVATLPKEPRSRSYDVWSLGCIYLEFMIWLLHGPDDLRDFDARLRDNYSLASGFYVLETPLRAARLHDEVKRELEFILHHQRCGENTALGDLAGFVQARMLDVDPMRRADSEEVVMTLTKIYDKAQRLPDYIFPLEGVQDGSVPMDPLMERLDPSWVIGEDLFSAVDSEESIIPEVWYMYSLFHATKAPFSSV